VENVVVVGTRASAQRDPVTAAHKAEFRTVDLILESDAATLAVDAFVLSWIKAERQLRRLVTHLVFQSASFSYRDVDALRRTLWNSKRVYFEGFEKGFESLYPRSLRDLIGPEYHQIRSRLVMAGQHRNKIFHGQLTSESLSRASLIEVVHNIREWCERLASSAQQEIGYDGFARNSFRKSDIPNLASRLKLQFTDVESYRTFVREYLERPR
jgi:hypothetical protein